jgi:hypothetical protein
VTGAELRGIVRAYAEADYAEGLQVDVDALVADLGGTSRRPFDLFDALVRQLAGPAPVWGEKTPGHLVWWRPIGEGAPWMRFVAVVRDPRAVVASNLEMPWRHDRTLPPWGDDMHLAFAYLWSFFQGQTRAMAQHLGPQRCLVLRYEDIVGDPDTTRLRLADFLGLPVGDSPASAPTGIVLPSESWKARALGPVAGDRVAAWQDQLDPRRAAEVALVCRNAMASFGYLDGRPSGPAVAAGWAGLGPLKVARLARYARSRRLHLQALNRTIL